MVSDSVRAQLEEVQLLIDVNIKHLDRLTGLHSRLADRSTVNSRCQNVSRKRRINVTQHELLSLQAKLIKLFTKQWTISRSSSSYTGYPSLDSFLAALAIDGPLKESIIGLYCHFDTLIQAPSSDLLSLNGKDVNKLLTALANIRKCHDQRLDGCASTDGDDDQSCHSASAESENLLFTFPTVDGADGQDQSGQATKTKADSVTLAWDLHLVEDCTDDANPTHLYPVGTLNRVAESTSRLPLISSGCAPEAIDSVAVFTPDTTSRNKLGLPDDSSSSLVSSSNVTPVSIGPKSPRTPRSMVHAIRHRFKKTLKPGRCDMCSEYMFNGFKCKECKFRCHRDCEPMAPPSCCLPDDLVNFFANQLKTESYDTPKSAGRSSVHHNRWPSGHQAAPIGGSSSSNPSSCNSSTPSSPAVIITSSSGSKAVTVMPWVQGSVSSVSPRMIDVKDDGPLLFTFPAVQEKSSIRGVGDLVDSGTTLAASSSDVVKYGVASTNGDDRSCVRSDSNLTDSQETLQSNSTLVPVSQSAQNGSGCRMTSQDSTSSLNSFDLDYTSDGPYQSVPSFLPREERLYHRVLSTKNHRIDECEESEEAAQAGGHQLLRSNSSQSYRDDMTDHGDVDSGRPHAVRYTASFRPSSRMTTDSGHGGPGDGQEKTKSTSRAAKSISVREWDIPVDELVFGDMIGTGRFSTVYQGSWHGDVAIKVFDRSVSHSIDAFRQIMLTMRKTRHENTVLFMGACMHPSRLAIVTSLCKGNTLFTHLHLRKDKFSTSKLIVIGQQIAQGMSYLHHRGIVHKDLKTKNVFLENGRPIIADFGLVSLTSVLQCAVQWTPSSQTTCKCGDRFAIAKDVLCYLAPEIVRILKAPVLPSDRARTSKIESGRQSPWLTNDGPRPACGHKTGVASCQTLPFSMASDVFAFGTIWYELITSQMPWVEQMRIAGLATGESLIWLVGRGLKPSLANLQASREVKDVLTICWTFKPEARPRFSQIANLLEKIPVSKKSGLVRSMSHSNPAHVRSGRSAESVF